MSSKLNPVRSAPTLIHAVALVGKDVPSTEHNIRQLMRGFPPQLYKLSNQLIFAVLGGQSLSWAQRQAKLHRDPDQAKYARLCLISLARFLRKTKPDWIRPLEVDPYQVGPGLQLPIRVLGLMKADGAAQVVVLHLWQKPLEERAFRAAATILKDRLQTREELSDVGLCWVDISMPKGSKRRLLRRYDWTDVALMDQKELNEFADTLKGGWDLYQSNPLPPRKSKKRPPSDQPDMFTSPEGPR